MKKIVLNLILVFIFLFSFNAFAGWVEEAGLYKYEKNGEYLESIWKKIDEKWYHFNDDGYMDTGLIKDNGDYYFLNDDGSAGSGEAIINGVGYKLAAKGKVVGIPANFDFDAYERKAKNLNEYGEAIETSIGINPLGEVYSERIDIDAQELFEEELLRQDEKEREAEEKLEFLALKDDIDFDKYTYTTIQNAEVVDAIEVFKDKYIKPGMSDFEKEMMIIQYLVGTVEYDYENYKNDTIPAESYIAYGALIKHICVCAGYADAFKKMCDACGLTAIKISGKCFEDFSGRHAWNQIKLNGKWYNVDVTWEDPDVEGYGFGKLLNRRINRTDAEFKKDHKPNGYSEKCSAIEFGPEAVDKYFEDNRETY